MIPYQIFSRLVFGHSIGVLERNTFVDALFAELCTYSGLQSHSILMIDLNDYQEKSCVGQGIESRIGILREHHV